MNRPTIVVSFDGEPMSLKRWAAKHGLSYSTVLYRWNHGFRDFDGLTKGIQPSREAPITTADIEYLQETRYARRGQWNEWEIACDLIGIKRYRAPELKRAVDG